MHEGSEWKTKKIGYLPKKGGKTKGRGKAEVCVRVCVRSPDSSPELGRAKHSGALLVWAALRCYLNLSICVALFIHPCAHADNQFHWPPHRQTWICSAFSSASTAAKKNARDAGGWLDSQCPLAHCAACPNTPPAWKWLLSVAEGKGSQSLGEERSLFVITQTGFNNCFNGISSGWRGRGGLMLHK